MNITKEEVQRLIEAFHADPHTADWDDALSLLRAKRDEKDAEPIGEALEALLCLTNVDSVEEYGTNFEIVETFLRAAHTQKDAGKILITPGGGAPGDPCGILAAKDAEPVAWLYRNMTNRELRVCQLAEHDDADFPVYLHPAHDDTALLRQALEALKELWDNFGVVCPSADLIDQYEAAITALRERLGEVK